MSSLSESEGIKPSQPIKEEDRTNDIIAEYLKKYDEDELKERDTIFHPYECAFNEKCLDNTINIDKNMCLVDLSYLTFTRFYATRNWYFNNYDKETIANDYNWLENKEFMEKFDKLFFDKCFMICEQYDIPMSNIIFFVDCFHQYNWRVKVNEDYKGTRKESHERNHFYVYSIFGYVRKNLICKLQAEHKNIVLFHPHLEADDVISCFNRYLRNNNYQHYIIILANDKDYIQICDEKTHLLDIQQKCISCSELYYKFGECLYYAYKNDGLGEKQLGSSLSLTEKSILNNSPQKEKRTQSIVHRKRNKYINYSSKNDYLLFKILYGDKSDNIEPCYLSNEFTSLYYKKNNHKDFLKATPKVIYDAINNVQSKVKLLRYLYCCRDYLKNNGQQQDFKYGDIKQYHYISNNQQFLQNVKLIDLYNIPIKYENRLFYHFQLLFGKFFKP